MDSESHESVKRVLREHRLAEPSRQAGVCDQGLVSASVASSSAVLSVSGQGLVSEVWHRCQRSQARLGSWDGRRRRAGH